MTVPPTPWRDSPAVQTERAKILVEVRDDVTWGSAEQDVAHVSARLDALCDAVAAAQAGAGTPVAPTKEQVEALERYEHGLGGCSDPECCGTYSEMSSTRRYVGRGTDWRIKSEGDGEWLRRDEVLALYAAPLPASPASGTGQDLTT